VWCTLIYDTESQPVDMDSSVEQALKSSMLDACLSQFLAVYENSVSMQTFMEGAVKWYL